MFCTDNAIALDSSSNNSIGGNISLEASNGDVNTGDITSKDRIGDNIEVEASGTIQVEAIAPQISRILAAPQGMKQATSQNLQTRLLPRFLRYGLTHLGGALVKSGSSAPQGFHS